MKLAWVLPVLMLVACSEKKNDLTDAQLVPAPFNDTLAGNFEELNEQQMADLGLKPEDFTPNYTAEEAIHPKISLGTKQSYYYQMQFLNGTLGVSRETINVIALNTVQKFFDKLTNGVLSIGTGVKDASYSETHHCAFKTSGTTQYLDCSETVSQQPQVDPLYVSQNAITCWVDSSSSDLKEEKHYGFYGGFEGKPKVKALLYKYEMPGTLKCSNNATPGSGLTLGTQVVTPEIPNLTTTGSTRSSGWIFGYYETFDSSKKLLSKSRIDLLAY